MARLDKMFVFALVAVMAAACPAGDDDKDTGADDSDAAASVDAGWRPQYAAVDWKSND